MVSAQIKPSFDGDARGGAGFRPRNLPADSLPGGFTLLEILVAMTISALLLVGLQQALSHASGQWRRTNESAKAFQDARAAFDSISRNLAQATLMVSYDYYNSDRVSRTQVASSSGAAGLKSFVPERYGRFSDLHFRSGKNLVAGQHNHAIFFQAPLGFEESSGALPSSGQLNANGYFVKYGSDAQNRPPNVSQSVPEPRNRFRLMRFFQPTERLDVYRDASSTSWFKTPVDAGTDTHLLAENIIVFVLLPKLAEEQAGGGGVLAPAYEYDSRAAWESSSQPAQMHQLPPIVRLLMVAIDETTAQRSPELGAAFQQLFKDPGKFEDDLATVTSELQKQRANFKVFQSDIPIRSAKWSE